MDKTSGHAKPSYHDDPAFKTFIELVSSIDEDIEANKIMLDEDESQPSRRNYVRAVFAAIEGHTFAMKSNCLFDEDFFSEGERIFLKEQTYRLTDKGDIRPEAAKIRTLHNILFAFKAFSSISGISSPIDTSSNGWRMIRDAEKIRNRITHPKDAEAFNVTDDELSTVKNALKYFQESLNKLLIESNVQLEIKMRDLQIKLGERTEEDRWKIEED